MKKKIKVFTSNDLDGAGGLFFIKWAFGDTCEVDYTISNIFNIEKDYNLFNNSEESDKYQNIFILNMIPNFNVKNNVLIFSKSDGNNKKELKGKIENINSTTRLLCCYLKKQYEQLSIERKKFLKIIDDFYIDGGEKNESIKLNAIFTYGYNKYSKFYERFFNGIEEYSDEEKEIIKHYVSVLKWVFKKLEIYEHHSKKGMYIAIINDMKYKHEILDILFKKYSPKIIFLVDLDNCFISARKDDPLKIDMSKLCDSLIEGRALKNCAGGKFTEKFIDFSKEFM